MQLVFDDGRNQQELDVRINDAGATVVDLVKVLTGSDSSGTTLLVDDHPARADLGVNEVGLVQGAILRLGSPAAIHAAAPVARYEVRVVGGLGAGRIVPVPPGQGVIGRDPGCDIVIAHPTVSRRHCQVQVESSGIVTITDLNSRTGTWIDGERISAPTRIEPATIVELGDVQLTVGPRPTEDRHLGVDPLRHADAGGTVPFNRPPRPAGPSAAGPLTAPTAPTTGDRPMFSLASTIAPLVLGGVMATVNPAFALFALFSPAMQIANWYESRHRARGTLRRESRTFHEELETFRAKLGEEQAREVRRSRELLPDPAEAIRRATLPSTRLWERRLGHEDFLHLSAGLADLPWPVPLGDSRATPAPEVAEVLAERATLPLVPVPVDLSGGGAVGIVGDRAVALSLARSLVCQAAVHHGPADLAIAVFTESGRTSEWDWAKWLPHTENPAGGGSRLLAGRPEECEALLGALLQGAGDEKRSGPVLLAVVDAEQLTEGRDAPARKLLRGAAGPVAGIVIASTEDRLPALCTIVVSARADGAARLERPQKGERVDSFPATGVDEDVARRCARALARFEDPELHVPGARLPSTVGLLPLLGLPKLDAGSIREMWRAAGHDPAPATPIGMSEEGPFFVDLAQTFHGLIGGTTGSGKSELLRTLVAGLAARLSPEHLTFVLIDFKGGSTFEECERFPHTVGVATDLDEQLAERALRCLRAELRYREARFHDAGVPDLRAYRAKRRQASGAQAARPLEPMPRLVVVIDEFAEMAASLPDFLDSLVGIARRGRSLGVHMILATQRPAGAVSDNIRANTDLRIALRVQDKADSVDVIEVPDAAAIPRNLGGRAYVRLGPTDVIPIQTALATGVSPGDSMAPVEAAPFCFGPAGQAAELAAAQAGAHGTAADLTRLVEAVGQAFAQDGQPPPRRPWTDPLPAEVELDAMLAAAGHAGSRRTAAFALADDPDAQTRYPAGWDLDGGNLLLYGILGSGTTTTLLSLALALARTRSPAELHLYALDFGAGALDVLTGLPHTGAVVAAGEQERQIRLVRFLRSELERRKQLRGAERDAEPVIVLLIDGYAAFSAAYEEAYGLAVAEDLARVYSDGPQVGIHTAATADRAGAIPSSIAALTKQKLVFRLPDSAEYGFFGISRRQVPAFTPGRALVAETAQELQVGRAAAVDEAVRAAAEHHRTTRFPRPPARIGVLPDEVALEEIAGVARVQPGADSWFLPLGIGDRTLEPVGLTLHEGEHAVVGGPARSGRSNTLALLAALVKQVAPDVQTLGVALRRSPLRDSPHLDRLVAVASELPKALEAGGSHLVLVDDAEAVEDPGEALSWLAASGRPDVHLVIAGRTDSMRSAYGHWTQTVRKSKVGLLLMPDVDLDGDLLGVQLPRRSHLAMRVGRGHLVNSGDVEIVQVARAPSS